MIISGGRTSYSVQVEEAIASHPAVLEVAVIGVPDEEWGETVKGFVVLKPGQEATEQQIIDQAKSQAASYQKPRSVEFVAEPPKAPTGKILKRELRRPFWEGQERNVRGRLQRPDRAGVPGRDLLARRLALLAGRRHAARRPVGDHALPVLAWMAGVGGMGMTWDDLFAWFDAVADDGPMFGEHRTTLHHPLETGATVRRLGPRGLGRPQGRPPGRCVRHRRLRARPSPGGDPWRTGYNSMFPRRGRAMTRRPSPSGPWSRPRAGRRPEKMKVMAALLGDPKRIHFDSRLLEELGLDPRPVSQGPLNMGYLQTMLARWAGGRERILSF